MRTVAYLVWKEYLHIVRDRATLFQVLAIPLMQLIVLGFAATFEIRETRVHLIDQDRSATSRELVSHFSGSGYFRIVNSTTSSESADEALRSGAAAMVLRIPAGFERDLVRDGRAPVQLVLDAEQGASAGIVSAYASRIIGDFERTRGASLAIDQREEGVAPAGARRSAPLEVSTRNRYNPELDYTAYMVPGILVALVTLIGTLLTAQNIAREKEIGTLEQLNVTPISRGQFILGKLIPFWILGMAELAIGLGLARLVFDIPVRGSLALIFAVAAVYLVAALALGLLISTVAETQQQAMFVTFFVMMVYLLMSGLYTPVTSMPEWAQTAAQANPVTHFVRITRSVLVKGAGYEAIRGSIAALGVFGAVALTLAVRQYSKRAA